jgi:hypothetical protein
MVSGITPFREEPCYKTALKRTHYENLTPAKSRQKNRITPQQSYPMKAPNMLVCMLLRESKFFQHVEINMNEKQDNNKKLKDLLLKSSLPLEQLVIEKLTSQRFWVAGVYPYIRPNEQNISTEFSVDLHAYTFIDNRENSSTSATLNFLIECKYSYQGTKWIFSPNASSILLGLAPEVGFLYCLTHQGKYRLYELTTDFPVCTRGIELTQDGSNPHNTSRGLSQLRYGMPNLIFQERESVQDISRPDLSFIGLVLVTTAELYVLKSYQSLETYRAAQSLDEIAYRTQALVVSQEPGPHLLQYCRDLLIPKLSILESDTITKGRAEQALANIIPRTFQIIVVHVDALDSLVATITTTVQSIVENS